MAATARAVAAPTMRQEVEALAAEGETWEARADVVISKYLETCRVPGVPQGSSDAEFWAKVPGHGRLRALHKILEIALCRLTSSRRPGTSTSSISPVDKGVDLDALKAAFPRPTDDLTVDEAAQALKRQRRTE